MSDPEVKAIISLLGDETEADRTLAQVLKDPDLLKRVYAYAEHEEQIPAILRDALLERYSTCLVEGFAAVETLEDGLWALPRLEHVLLDHAVTGRRRLDALALAIGARADGAALARALVEEYCFGCDPRGHQRVANSFLPAVLESRCGLPLVVTALWKLLCDRRGLTAEIVVFPGRIYGRWEDGFLDFAATDWLLSEKDLRTAAVKQGYHDPARFLRDAEPSRVLQRLCLNLAVTYRHLGDMVRCNLAVIVGQMLG